MKNITVEFTPFLGIGIGVGSRLNNKVIVILFPFISLEIACK